jgi:8-oxo-dGTP diphosphatase
VIVSANQRPSAAPKVAAGVIFVDEKDRIMLVRPTYKPYWDIPGGYVEQGETPLQACHRELAEELSLQVPISTLLSVDWAPHPEEGDKVLFIFDGGILTADQLSGIAFRDGEIQEFAFVDESELEAFTIPVLLAASVRQCRHAGRSSRPIWRVASNPRTALRCRASLDALRIRVR